MKISTLVKDDSQVTFMTITSQCVVIDVYLSPEGPKTNTTMSAKEAAKLYSSYKKGGWKKERASLLSWR